MTDVPTVLDRLQLGDEVVAYDDITDWFDVTRGTVRAWVSKGRLTEIIPGTRLFWMSDVTDLDVKPRQHRRGERHKPRRMTRL